MKKSARKFRKNSDYEDENNYYKNKCKTLKKDIKEHIFENAAVCDEIALTQEKLLIVQEECKFLRKKLKPFEPPMGNPGRVKVDEVKTVVKKNAPKKKTTTSATTTCTITYKNSVRNTNGATKSKRPIQTAKRRKNDSLKPFISGNVTVFNFGQIVIDTPFYHTDCAIYPAGYYATRTYAHFRNLFSKCTYHCRVIKAGHSPRFEIMDHDKHFKVTGLSTDECHSHLVSLINKMLGAQNIIHANRNGDRFFGLTLPPVRRRLQEKPESKMCTAYIPLKAQYESYEAEVKAENDPAVSFEGLHSCLNRFRARR